jgi:hypothetical protein
MQESKLFEQQFAVTYSLPRPINSGESPSKSASHVSSDKPKTLFAIQ